MSFYHRCSKASSESLILVCPSRYGSPTCQSPVPVPSRRTSRHARCQCRPTEGGLVDSAENKQKPSLDFCVNWLV